MSDKDDPYPADYDYYAEPSDEEEELPITSAVTPYLQIFKRSFVKYRLMSVNAYVEEFVGDRVFNLSMARYLISMYAKAGVAKSAFSVFTSNANMSSALSYTNLSAKTDCLASDLEITCYWADESEDKWYINMAAKIVSEWCLNNTEYTLKWFKQTEAHITAKESKSHSKRSMVGTTITRDYSRDPISQVMEVCQARDWVKPHFDFKQTDLLWQCKTTFQGKEYAAVGLSKSDSKKATCSQILDYLVKNSSQ